MTSRPSDSRAEGDLPTPVVLNLDDIGSGSPTVLPMGTVVLLISGDVDRRWAADAAIGLGSRWAREGRRIVLADFHLENPLLHTGLDLPNLEGVVDIFLYGASLSRIAKPVRDGLFYLIPAGTYAPDIGEIYTHPRWKKLIAGFRDTGATLVLFVPADGADLRALAKWSSEAVLLGTPKHPEIARELKSCGLEVLAVYEPPSSVAAAPAETSPDPPAGPRRSAPRRPRQQRSIDPGLELPPPPVRRPAERKGVSIFLWIVFAIIVVATAVYLVAVLRPDLLRTSGAAGAAVGSVEVGRSVEPEPGPSRMGELLPYSVQVKAFTSLVAARADLAEQTRRVGSIPFLISPERLQGILYYRILAGLATDTLSAISLRDRLLAAGVIDPDDAIGGTSLIQFAPLAFDLGEFTTVEAAVARADSLADLALPTYPVQVPYSDGSNRWHLYGGAFRDSASASGMRDMLEANDVAAILTARTGVPGTAPE